MRFFDYDIVRAEAAELMRIQQDLQDLFRSEKFHSQEGRESYFFLMERLLEIQEIIYFRAKYSDTEDAKEYIRMLNENMHLVARSGETSVSDVYKRMKRDLKNIKDFVLGTP